MKSLSFARKNLIIRWLFASFAICAMMTAFVLSSATLEPAKAQTDSAERTATVFTNPAVIAPADRTSNNAGTNPGLPALYPSPIVVSGLSGTITKVTVTFAITSTFPDDFDILLVGPTGARSLVMSDAGGSGDPVNVSYTWDQTAATTMPNDPTTIVPTGTFQPSNFLGFATPEPGGQDNFPTAGGLMSYPTTFNVFNGTAPNGTWNLYVVDDQVIDTMSLPGGWSIDITTAVTSDAAVDFNGDAKTDYVVVRNVGGGANGQVRWFYNINGGGATEAKDWGLATDFFFSEDYDGDLKDDIAVWRPGAPTVAAFYILNSATLTARVETFGQSGDDPTVPGDYDGDGDADLAVYRAGAAAGDPSTWFYRLTPNGPVTYQVWGKNGDFPAPGDYDGNGSADFGIQRNDGGGNGQFWIKLSTGATLPVTTFGTSSDLIIPGDYDGDGKTDIATARGSGGQIIWFWRPSGGGADQQVTFGASASDFPTQGDYNGDGKTDVAIWRSSANPNESAFWTRDTVSGAVTTFALGAQGDYPVANFNSH